LKFGVNVWSFPKSVDVVEAMKASKRIGYDGFEPALTQDHLQMDQGDFDAYWKRIKEEAASIGIEIPSVATGLFWRFNPLSDPEGAMKVANLLCRAAHIVEAKVVLVVPGTARSDWSLAQCLERAAKFLKDVGKIAMDVGVIVGVENVWNRMLGSPIEMKRLLDEVAMDNVKLYLDVGNTLPHSLPEHWIDELGIDRIAQIHVKDFSVAELRFGIPLTGDVNWVAIRDRLQKHGYGGYLVAEVPPYRGHPFKAAMDALTSLKEVFGG